MGGDISRIQNSKVYAYQLEKTYHVNGTERVILKDVTFSVKEGEFVCFLGPSGCGKSTILNIISGLDTEYEGQIFINGKLKRCFINSAENTANNKLLFQNTLFAGMTVEKNILFALACRSSRNQAGTINK